MDRFLIGLVVSLCTLQPAKADWYANANPEAPNRAVMVAFADENAALRIQCLEGREILISYVHESTDRPREILVDAQFSISIDGMHWRDHVAMRMPVAPQHVGITIVDLDQQEMVDLVRKIGTARYSIRVKWNKFDLWGPLEGVSDGSGPLESEDTFSPAYAARALEVFERKCWRE